MTGLHQTGLANSASAATSENDIVALQTIQHSLLVAKYKYLVVKNYLHHYITSNQSITKAEFT